MKKTIAIIAAVLISTLFVSSTQADEAEDALKELVGKINTKLRDTAFDDRTAENFKDEIAEFGKLLEKYKDATDETKSYIVFMRTMLNLQVFKDYDAAKEDANLLIKDYPKTTYGSRGKDILGFVDMELKTAEKQAALSVGKKFPAFDVKDLDGKALNLDRFKGKIVLIDFWATWCGPCVGELPNVKEAYKSHHKDGFEIIGISLDQDRSALTKFIAKEGMEWPQYFDGKGWDNDLAKQYGITGIPATFLVDGTGTIIGRDLRGNALKEKVASVVGK